MNFLDLQNECWGFFGMVDAGNQHNYRRRMIRDKINVAYDKVATAAPYILCLAQETTLALVANVDTYFLNDWCLRPMSGWTETNAAHKIRFHNARYADRMGLRNPNLTTSNLGPWDATWFPRNRTAAKSGISATAAEAATAVTLVGYTADANDIGRMLRLNGEDGDYMILTVASGSVGIDRPVKSRVPMDDNTTGIGTGYTAVRWEIGPPSRVQIKILPKPVIASTMYYRYAALPRVLLNDTDTPEIPREWHHLLWKGALAELTLHGEDQPNFAAYKAEFDEQLAWFKSQDVDDEDAEDSPHYESLNHNSPLGVPLDEYRRDWNG